MGPVKPLSPDKPCTVNDEAQAEFLQASWQGTAVCSGGVPDICCQTPPSPAALGSGHQVLGQKLQREPKQGHRHQAEAP